MWYAQVKKIPPAQVRKELIEQALSANAMTADDLIRKLGHINLTLGRVHLNALLQGEENRPLLRRVAALLNISTEELIGERVFTDRNEYRRFVFTPKLVRVPEKTIPQQILPVALAGIDKFLCVGCYPELLTVGVEDQNNIIGTMIREDYPQNNRSIFGAIVGYVFLPSYDECRPFDISGSMIPDAVVERVRVSASAGKERRDDLTNEGGVIFQFRKKQPVISS